MSLKKNLKIKKAQAALEYMILFTIVLAVLIASGFFTRVQASFQNHFNEAVSCITGG